MLGIDENQVKRGLIQKMILWEEVSVDPTERRCPYTGVQISLAMLLGDEVEIEHILPFSRTLDDSLNNKTVRSEEHTSELQSLMRISYAVFCLKKKKKVIITRSIIINI